MSSLYIPIIEGTTRPKRESIKVARFILGVAQTIPDVESEIIDPTNFNLPFDGRDPENSDPRWTAITARTNAFFIVAPEYNHSYSGSLKRFMDVEFNNYMHKPVALAGVSSGPWGGVRAIEALLHPLKAMGLIVMQKDVQFPMVEKLFDEQGKMIPDKVEKYTERVKNSYQELIWLASRLK